jgi:hypothetical protein
MNNVRKFERLAKDAATLDQAVAARKARSPKQPLVEAASPDDSVRLLDEVREFLCRFVAYPHEHASVAHVLWIFHAHAMEAWDSTPRLAFLSPEPASGKTRALEVTELLVPNPLLTVNASVSYIFRRVGDEAHPPTILYDEIDAVFTKVGDNEPLRALLNAGHRKGAKVGRCQVLQRKVQVVESSAYCAVALAGLGHLPDTIRTRSVVIRMRKRGPREHVQPLRRRAIEPDAAALRDRIANWADAYRARLASARPSFPPGVEDRDADIWEALLAVADAAGGHWPGAARSAAGYLVGQARQSRPSLGVLLLEHLREAIGEAAHRTTAELLASLQAKEEAPWRSLRGEPLDARRLAQLLREFDIRSCDLRTDEGTKKGYRREDFHDAWTRYLRPQDAGDGGPRLSEPDASLSIDPMSATSATSATSPTEAARAMIDVDMS